MKQCLFCNIVGGSVPATIRYQDDQVMAFDDISPSAPIHILVIPKKHISSLAHVSTQDGALLGHLLLTVHQLAAGLGLEGYKTAINTGRQGGQIVDHLHLHLLANTEPKASTDTI